MEANLVAVWIHSLERIVAVLLGGMALYYGFRLFHILPLETHSDGKIGLPGISVVLAKAGPGLFFAAFGSLVILVSLFRPIKVEPDGGYSGIGDTGGPTPKFSPLSTSKSPPSEQDVARVNLAVQSINCMHHLAGPRAAALTEDLDQAVREAKLALLSSAWNGSTWGEFEAFKSWANGGRRKTESPARAIFESERADCPR